MPNAYRMQRPFLHLVGITILQCWHLVAEPAQWFLILACLRNFTQRWNESIPLLCWAFFFPFRLLSFVLLLIVCITHLLSCGCASSGVDCLLYLNEVGKSYPIAKPVCPRGKSFWFSPSALSARGSSHGGVMQKDLRMQKWCASCFSSGDGVRGRQIPTQATLTMYISPIWRSPCWYPSQSWSNRVLWVLTVQYTWRTFPQTLKAQGVWSILNVSYLQPVLMTVFEDSN